MGVVCGYISSIRNHKNIVFVDLIHRNKKYQIMFAKPCNKRPKKGTVLCIRGSLSEDKLVEVECSDILYKYSQTQSSGTKDSEYASRAKEVMYQNIMCARYSLLHQIRKVLELNNIIEVTAPVITTTTIYQQEKLIALEGKLSNSRCHTFLTNCVSMHLEPLADVMGNIFSIGPSFRDEYPSTRHMHEYWHLKMELINDDLLSAINLVENILKSIMVEFAHTSNNTRCPYSYNGDALIDISEQYARIEHQDVEKRICNAAAGADCTRKEKEEYLKHTTKRPYWLLYPPDDEEPKLYKRIGILNGKTRVAVADLILPKGYGELLGIAVKTDSYDDMYAAYGNKECSQEYRWIIDRRRNIASPHIGVGIGIDRLLRWLMGIKNISDTIPYPRAKGYFLKT